MFEEDFFRFIPADNETYDHAVLLAPEQESRHSRNFFGIIKTGDKCVPHSKSNPKQRRKIENISKEVEIDGCMLPATADRILWSDETFNVLHLANRSLEESPVVIKLASNLSKFSCVELSYGQNLLVHNSGTEQRLVAYDVTTSKQLDIPFDLECHVLWKGRHLKVNEVLGESLTPVKVKVTQCNSRVDNFVGHVFLLKEQIQSKFVVCSLVHAGWVDQSGLLVIPESIGAEFMIGGGLRGSGEEEWSDFLGMLKRSVRHQLDNHIKGYPEIIVHDIDEEDHSSFVTDSKIHLPCYENVELNLTKNIDLEQFQIQTMRPSSNIYKNILNEEPKKDVLKHDDITSHINRSHQMNPKCDNISPKPVSQTSYSTGHPVVIKSQRVAFTNQSQSNKQPMLSTTEDNKTYFMKKNYPEVPANKKQPVPSKRAAISSSKFSKEPTPASRVAEQFAFPEKLEGLPMSEIKKCLEGLGLEKYCKKGSFDIDGLKLSNMSTKDLEISLNMTPFDANKVSRFIRGWRP